jgi:NO-binding membrane sensor protein with MHYT domain
MRGFTLAQYIGNLWRPGEQYYRRAHLAVAILRRSGRMDHSSVIQTSYEYWLVAASVLIAVFASYTALDLAARVSTQEKIARWAWLLGGAVAMGTGIWSMHYTGMLAYRLPIPVYYHVPTVLLSLAAAVCASFIALFVVSQQRIGVLHVGVGSVLVAGGIVGMHYTGMAAMRVAAMHHWDQELVIASIVVAWLVSLAGLGLMKLNLVMGGSGQPGSDKMLKIVCAVTMGLAIPAMHYTAMAAVSFTPMQQAPELSFAVEISDVANAAIILVSVIVLGSVFLIRWWANTPTVAAVGEPSNATLTK